jgi:hypothetical protein
MTKKVTLILPVLFVLVNAIFIAPYISVAAAGGKSDDDCAVLQATLHSLVESADGKYFIVSSEPRAVGLEHEWIAAHLTAASKNELAIGIDQLIADYEKRNAKEQLTTRLEGSSLRFMDARTLAEMFHGEVIGGWKRFRVKFPGAEGLLDLSLPGYSLDGMRAIVCYSVSRGSLSGEVWVALLRRKAGSWDVEWREILVQS